MNLNDVRAKARELGVPTKGLGKGELIQAIQKAEGNQPCFGRNDGSCQYGDCCFWEDCLECFLAGRANPAS
jgi:hypothetical protein